MMERAFKGIWIPKEIWLDKNLNWVEKVLLVEIDSLDNDQGCWASNAYFADFFNLSKNRISILISNLANKGYINVDVKYKEGTKQVEKRIIKIEYTYIRKHKGGICENEDTPICENAKENNTVFNNTDEYIDDDRGDEHPAELIQRLYGHFPSGLLQKAIASWLKVWSREMICLAIKKANENFVELQKLGSYAGKILDNWKEAGIDTPEKVTEADERFKNRRKNNDKQKQLSNFDTSEYDNLF